ncbi:hypothetical protein FO519_006373 [Halicephalobus sp. NKZ332]|nr:hypothetical protein FO519_006373 [Halicephalobus sp. NKZ332]
MSVVSAPSSSSYRNPYRSRREYRPPVAGGFGRLKYDQDRAGLLPHSRSFDKSSNSYPREERSYFNDNDNATVVSGCTSVCSYSALASQQQRLEKERREQQKLQFKEDNTRHCCCSFSFLCRLNFAGFVSFLSILAIPSIIVAPFVAPYFGYDWPGVQCDLNSQRFLLVIGICLVVQIIIVWKVHSRKPSARLPRIVLSRVAFTLSLIFVLIGFGLSFVANDFIPKNPNYVDILLHALLLLVTTFLIHSLWYFFELKQPQILVTVHVTRDPDGESKSFSIKECCIQEAVVELLSRYTAEFPSFNPYKFRAKKDGQGSFKLNGTSGGIATGFKVYAIEEFEGPEAAAEPDGVISVNNAKILIQAAVRRGRKDRKEAFAHVNAINTNNAKFKVNPMDPSATAKIILAVIFRPLNKYLKVTQQHNYFHFSDVEDHLRNCLTHGFTSDTFLQPFFASRIPINEDFPTSSKWSLLCDTHPANTIAHGQQFVLRCLDPDNNLNIRLFCKVDANPVFNVVQERSRNSAYTYQFNLAPSPGQTSPV